MLDKYDKEFRSAKFKKYEDDDEINWIIKINIYKLIFMIILMIY